MYFGFFGTLSLHKRAADKLGDSIRRMADGWADMIQYKYARADAVMDNRMQWSNKIFLYVNGNYIVCERRYICDGSVAVGRFRSSFSMLVMEYMIRPIDTNISALFILTTIVAQHVNLQPICIRAYIFMWAIVVEGVGTRRAKLMQQAGEELAGVG